MSQCELCNSTENVDGHHISYEPEKKIPLCRSCHQKVHADEDHKYNPDDSAPTTVIEITTDQRDALQDRKQHERESYKAVLDRLLAEQDAQNDTDGGAWTDDDVERFRSMLETVETRTGRIERGVEDLQR